MISGGMRISYFLSFQGDLMFDSLLHIGTSGKVNIKMVENYPPKDKGDNSDGIILQNNGLSSSVFVITSNS